MVKAVRHLLQTILAVARALAALPLSMMRSRAQLAAENLFLRKQLALYQERKVKPRRADDATRIVLAGLSRFLAWRQLLVIVKPQTLIRWHRQGFRLFWRRKSRRPGRPPISPDVQRLIATMAAANRTWGEEPIANELLVTLGIRLSPRTGNRSLSRLSVRRYRPPSCRNPKVNRIADVVLRNIATDQADSLEPTFRNNHSVLSDVLLAVASIDIATDWDSRVTSVLEATIAVEELQTHVRQLTIGFAPFQNPARHAL